MKTPAVAAGAMLLTASAVLYRHVAADLVHAWATDGNYSHGFLVVPAALYFAWRRRERFRQAPGRPSATGLAIVAASVALLAAGVLGAELFLTRLSMLGVVAGAIVFLAGWRRLLVLAAPLALLLLMIPLPAIVFNQIAFPLQLLASRVGEATLSALAVPVVREGNVLVLPQTTLEVAEACSGIRSLVSLVFVGVVFAAVTDPRAWVRSAIVAATVPLAVLANGLRVAATGAATQFAGPAAAEGLAHELAGWLTFVASCLLLVSFARVLRRWAPAC